MARFRYKHGDKPLDGYTVEHGLGVGGFGEVYFAVSDSGREVALKAVQNYEEIELRGIRHCMNLKSPHLVTIFDVRHNEEEQPFVIMEYVQGPCLRELLDNSPAGLGATKASFFLREIAKGLTYLHEAGVVHRDLKPHNVFYEDGFVKIGDYSLCKMISTSHRSGHTMTVGTVHYMAPEISEGRYDASVDIYALGIILFEMLTGSPPFVGDSMGEVLMKHMTAEPDLSSIDEPFRSTIAKAIAKRPEDRYTSAAELVESVFGADHVQNSVVEFNPQELTMVAKMSTKQVLATPSGRSASSRPGGASWGKTWKPSDSTPENAVRVYTAEPVPPRQDRSDDHPPAVPSPPAISSELLPATDAMPAVVRFGLAAGVISSLALLLQLLNAGAALGVMRLGLLVAVAIAVTTAVVLGLQRLTPRKLRSSSGFAARVLFSGFLYIAVTAAGLAVNLFNEQIWSQILVAPLCVALPFVPFDWPSLLQSSRTRRLYGGPVAGVFVLALVCAAIYPFAMHPVVCSTVATGVAICLQIMSPFRRSRTVRSREKS